jgi:hypothetical protein
MHYIEIQAIARMQSSWMRGDNKNESSFDRICNFCSSAYCRNSGGVAWENRIPPKAKLNFWEITLALFKNHGQEIWHCDNNRKQDWGFAVARKWNETYDGVGCGEIPPHEGLRTMLIIARGIQPKKAVKLCDSYV